MSQWYYSPDNKNQIGPLDDADMRDAVRQGLVHSRIAVFKVGETEWKAAAAFQELFAQGGANASQLAAEAPLPWSVEPISDETGGWRGLELAFKGMQPGENQALSRYFQYYLSCAFERLPRIALGKRPGSIQFIFAPHREAPLDFFSRAPLALEQVTMLRDTLKDTAERLSAKRLYMWTIDPRLAFYADGKFHVVPAFWLPALATRGENYPGAAAEWREADSQPRADIYAIASACFLAATGKRYQPGDECLPRNIFPPADPLSVVLGPALRFFSQPGSCNPADWIGHQPPVPAPIQEISTQAGEALDPGMGDTPPKAGQVVAANPEFPEGKRYAAFISYSHANAEWAKWLHEKLEKFVLPEKKTKTVKGAKVAVHVALRKKSRTGKKKQRMLDVLPVERWKESLIDFKDDVVAEVRGMLKRKSVAAEGRRIYPVFRDQDELPTSADLSTAINDALRRSEFLLVICSPAAAQSRWVNEEVRLFKILGRESRILAMVVDGEPNASYENKGGRTEIECFPPALRYWVDKDGETTEQRVEPLAADLRAAESPRDKSEKDLLDSEFLRIACGALGAESV